VTYAADRADANDHPILHAAIALSPQIRASTGEIERARRLPKSIVDTLKQAGIFGMPMPRVWCGPELDPLTQFRVLETLAMATGRLAGAP
jgi:alkylation response protein AidB-like acyl-CoA dehydrogenase